MTNPKSPLDQTSNRGFQRFDPQKRNSSKDGSSGGNFADDPEPAETENPRPDSRAPKDPSRER